VGAASSRDSTSIAARSLSHIHVLRDMRTSMSKTPLLRIARVKLLERIFTAGAL